MNKEPGRHDFSGGYAPGNSRPYGNNCETFSVGIFKWVPKSNGKGLKKSTVVHRVKGYSSSPDIVYDAAQKLCEKMDNGFVPKNKSTFVKTCQTGQK